MIPMICTACGFTFNVSSDSEAEAMLGYGACNECGEEECLSLDEEE